eukprot:3932611-Rhodomonas_salina.2
MHATRKHTPLPSVPADTDPDVLNSGSVWRWQYRDAVAEAATGKTHRVCVHARCTVCVHAWVGLLVWV